MDFVKEMLYDHQGNRGDMAPLLHGAEYREVEERLNSLLEAVTDNGFSADIRQAALVPLNFWLSTYAFSISFGAFSMIIHPFNQVVFLLQFLTEWMAFIPFYTNFSGLSITLLLTTLSRYRRHFPKIIVRMKHFPGRGPAHFRGVRPSQARMCSICPVRRRAGYSAANRTGAAAIAAMALRRDAGSLLPIVATAVSMG